MAGESRATATPAEAGTPTKVSPNKSLSSSSLPVVTGAPLERDTAAATIGCVALVAEETCRSPATESACSTPDQSTVAGPAFVDGIDYQAAQHRVDCQLDLLGEGEADLDISDSSGDSGSSTTDTGQHIGTSARAEQDSWGCGAASAGAAVTSNAECRPVAENTVSSETHAADGRLLQEELPVREKASVWEEHPRICQQVGTVTFLIGQASPGVLLGYVSDSK